jgi:ECF sigma factor
MTAPSAEITTLLKAWRRGDQQALDRLTPLVYDHLRKLARHYVRKERPDAQMNATALVHEAYVRLVDARAVDWQDRAHFLPCPPRGGNGGCAVGVRADRDARLEAGARVVGARAAAVNWPRTRGDRRDHFLGRFSDGGPKGPHYSQRTASRLVHRDDNLMLRVTR